MNTQDSLIYIVTIILSVGAFIGSLSNDFFGLVSGDTNILLVSFFVSILLLLFGDRIASGVRGRDMVGVISGAFAGIPQFNTVTEFSSGDDAMEYLSSKIMSAKVVWNTKISKAGIQPRSDVAKAFEDNLKKALKKGLQCKDIVSATFSGCAKSLNDESKDEKFLGAYEYSELEAPACFLNFIVLQYEDDEEELLFGWATSTYNGMEQKAYKIRDERVIGYFKNYHSALFNG